MEEARVDLVKFMKAGNHLSSRASWDNLINKAYCLKVDKNKTMIEHIVQNTPFSFMNDRDLINKRFVFMKDGAYYAYFSAIPTNVHPKEANIERMEIIVGIVKFTIYEE
jgi:hypothetical protein